MPSAAPVAPSASPAPSAEQTLVTVQISLGFDPFGVSWSIETLDGQVLFEVEEGAYIDEPGAVVQETTSVPAGAVLNFVLEDSFGFGIQPPDGFPNVDVANVFLGGSVDYSKSIARVNTVDIFGFALITSFTASEEGIVGGLFQPTTPPTPAPVLVTPPSFVGLPEATVTLVIQFDLYPMDTSWEIEYPNAGGIVASGGPYGPFLGESTTETITLLEGATYDFTVYDDYYDGICCESGEGSVHIYLGSTPGENNILLYDNGEFLSSSTSTFTVSAGSTIAVTDPPVDAPTMTPVPTATFAPTKVPFEATVTILLDEYPLETSWAIVDAVDGTVQYEGGVDSSVATEVSETVLLEPGAEYIFLIYDSAFDGIFDGGFGIVSVGPSYSEEAVLAFIPGDSFFDVGRVTFIASADSTIDFVTSSPSESPIELVPPTVAPTFLPTTTAVPSSSSQVTVTIELVFRDSGLESGYGVMIETTDTSRTVFRDGPTGFFFRGDTWTTSTLLDQGREYLFTVTDSFGVGQADARVYLGAQVDSLRTLAILNDDFGFVRKQFFVASEDGVVDVTASPTFFPTIEPSAQPSVSPSPSSTPTKSQVPSASPAPTGTESSVTLLFNLDNYPGETGWEITDSNGIVLAFASPGTYAGLDQEIQMVQLVAGASYTLTVTDSFGDGICCGGGVFLFLGTDTDPMKVLLYIGDDFGSSTSETFVVSDNGFIDDAPEFVLPPTTTPTTISPSSTPSLSMVPSSSPAPTGSDSSVMLLFVFDSYASETSWSIIDTAGDTVASVLPGAYSDLSTATEVIELTPGGSYTLNVYDAFNDGICCLFGDGQFFLFLGDVMDPARVLVHNNGVFGSLATHPFTLSIDDLMSRDDVPDLPEVVGAPSLAPTISPVQTKSNRKGKKDGKKIPAGL